MMGESLKSFLVVYYVSLGWETDTLMNVDILALECWKLQLKFDCGCTRENIGDNVECI
jgi:hypothetical protein